MNCVQLQDYDLVAITEAWCDDSHDCQAAMKGYQIFRKHKAGRQRAVALHMREQFECVEPRLVMDDEPTKRLGGLRSRPVWVTYGKPRRFLKSINDNFVTQAIEDPVRERVLLDIMLINKEGLIKVVML